MKMTKIIAKKRDGETLNAEEIRYWIDGVTKNTIPDYQTSALLMAIYLNGMNDDEAIEMSLAIRDSGDKIDGSLVPGYKVDKHSTGGVGDKTSVIIVPLLAALGAKVAKMSGRGLGHTGGTVDKLESIKGYRTAIEESEFLDIVRNVGCSIIGQSEKLAPADKRLYALRDVTETVANRALIASSIMGKKLTSGANGIVLDVKYGSGSFNKDIKEATALANLMRRIGESGGMEVTTILSDMNVPLGNAIGNSLEIIEACEVLKGRGPEDLKEECVRLAVAMADLAFPADKGHNEDKVRRALADGTAFAKFKEMCAAHGGDTRLLDDYTLFKQPAYQYEIRAPWSGKIVACNTSGYGYASLALGAGRNTKEDAVDPSAGLLLHKKVGDTVAVGDVIATAYSDKAESFADAQRILEKVTFVDE